MPCLRHWMKSVNCMTDVTRILKAIEGGDPQAADRLLPLVYDGRRGTRDEKAFAPAPRTNVAGNGAGA